jgi:EpsI family protein
VIACAVWLVLTARRTEDTARGDHPRERLWQPVLLLALALAGWLIAYRSNIELGKQILAPPIVWLAIACVAGRRMALSLTGPIAFLYFAIPVWEEVVPLLQWLAVTVASGVMGLIGVPVHIDGILVTIPEGSFIVQDACSGKRYLVVALAAASMLAATGRLDWRRTLRYLGLTAAMALVVNWVRIIIVIYAGHATHMHSYLVAREHVSLGYAMFALLLLAVLRIGLRLARPTSSSPEARSAPAAPFPPSRVTALRLGATALLLCVPSLAALDMARSETPSGASAVIPVPHAGAGWHGPLATSGLWIPDFPGAPAVSRAAYESDAGLRVETYWAAYAAQQPDSKLIHYSNHLTTPKWMLLSRSPTQRRLQGHTEITVRTLLTQAWGSGSRWLIDYYYVVGGVEVTQDWAAQVLYGLLSWGRPAPAGVFAVAAACAPDCKAAERALSAYWSEASLSPSLPDHYSTGVAQTTLK